APLFGVVTYFDVSDQRKILAERMADKAVVGQDAAQVRMTLVDDAEQVERLTLEPVGHRPQLDERGNDREVVIGGIGAQAQTLIVANRQQLHDGGKSMGLTIRARTLVPIETAWTKAFH